MYGKRKKPSKPRKENVKKPFISEEKKEKVRDRIIRDIRKLYEMEEQKEKRKESEKKKKQ